MFSSIAAQDGKSKCVTKVTSFAQHEFWGQYSANQKAILSKMNKEKLKRILGNIGWIKSRRLDLIW